MTHHIEERFVEVEGGRVFCRCVGKGARGTPLLALHGGPGAPHDYLAPLEALADERPVWFYDQLGCGRSDRPHDPSLWTLARYVRELAKVRAALGLDRFFLFGQSWGSMLAVEYALDEGQEGIAGLVLTGACLSAARFEADQRRYVRELPEKMRNAIVAAEASGDCESPEYQDAMMEYYRRHICRLDPWPEVMVKAFEQLNREIYLQMWGESEFTVTGTLKNFDLTERLGEIRVPTFLMCGEFDEATPESTREYQRRITGAESAVIEGTSHMHLIEKPDECLRRIRDFLHRAEK